MKVQMFKAQKQTRRFNKNQIIWVSFRHANHLEIWHKWRGKGRYVSGTIDRFHKAVGELKTIEVTNSFGTNITRHLT